jgi:hypothetical protein
MGQWQGAFREKRAVFHDGDFRLQKGTVVLISGIRSSVFSLRTMLHALGSVPLTLRAWQCLLRHDSGLERTFGLSSCRDRSECTNHHSEDWEKYGIGQRIESRKGTNNR